MRGKDGLVICVDSVPFLCGGMLYGALSYVF